MTGPSWDLSAEVSPLGAGGWPEAEIHHPPPLPWAGRSYEHRHLCICVYNFLDNLLTKPCKMISYKADALSPIYNDIIFKENTMLLNKYYI